MTGARRFSLSSPDWGQDHLSLDAIVAYVDDELSRGRARPRARPTSTAARECRAEVVRPAPGPRGPACRGRPVPAVVAAAQPAVDPGRGRAAPAAARPRGSPRTGSSCCCATSRGPIPVRARHATSTTCTLRLPRPAPGRPGPGPVAAPRRFSRRARIGAVSGLALSALAVGALAAPGSTPEPVAPSGVLGGVLVEVPPQLSPAVGGRPRPRYPADGPSAAPVANPAVLDAQLRDRLNRIPAAFHPDPWARAHGRGAR